MSAQPVWELVANLGDVNPMDYGGYFIFRDKTRVYCAEGEYLQTPSDDDNKYYVYRFSLSKCTYQNGILSDNQFHPEHAVWFARPESERAERPQDSTYLSNVAKYCGLAPSQLIIWFCSDDIQERAEAYRCIGSYHGWDNLDSYPCKLTRDEAEARYASIL